MKNIGLLISTINSGGAERVVSHLSRLLSSKYNVHVIIFEDTFMEYECSGSLHNLDVPATQGGILTKIGLLRKRIKRLRDVIKKEQLECVISFLDSPNIVNALSKVKGCKTIVSIRNYTSLEDKKGILSRLTDCVMRRIYSKVDYVVAVSKLIEDEYKRHYSIDDDKIVTIYNPYDFATIQAMATEALDEFETKFFSDKFVYCNVGRMMYQKGLWHLLKAFSQVKEKRDNVGLVIVGEDYTDGKAVSLINSLGLEGSVLLVGRSKNPYKYMANSNAYVLSSLFEGFPNAMVEAMACGLPIIAADCKSGPREILDDECDYSTSIMEPTKVKYGILVPSLEMDEDWEYNEITLGEKALAQAMDSLVCDEEICKELSILALERAREFDYSRCCDAYSLIIEEEAR